MTNRDTQVPLFKGSSALRCPTERLSWGFANSTTGSITPPPPFQHRVSSYTSATLSYSWVSHCSDVTFVVPSMEPDGTNVYPPRVPIHPRHLWFWGEVQSKPQWLTWAPASLPPFLTSTNLTWEQAGSMDQAPSGISFSNRSFR